MEISVAEQLSGLLYSLLAGAIAGLVYDAVRQLRYGLGFDVLFDVLYWSFVLFVLFTLGIGAGDGALHIMLLASSGVGAWAYFLLLSGTVRKMLDKIQELLSIAFSPLKKFSRLAKNVFSKAFAWFRIVKKSKRKGRNEKPDEIPQTDGDNSDGAHSPLRPEPRRRKKRFKRGERSHPDTRSRT